MDALASKIKLLTALTATLSKAPIAAATTAQKGGSVPQAMREGALYFAAAAGSTHEEKLAFFCADQDAENFMITAA